MDNVTGHIFYLKNYNKTCRKVQTNKDSDMIDGK